MLPGESTNEVLLMGLPKPLLTEDEYLRFERAAPERHLYFDGQIFAMAGEAPAHADITSNVLLAIGNQLGDGPCRARVATPRFAAGRFPDLRSVSQVFIPIRTSS